VGNALKMVSRQAGLAAGITAAGSVQVALTVAPIRHDQDSLSATLLYFGLGQGIVS